MSTTDAFKLGVMCKNQHAPQDVPAFARQCEASGFDQCWVVEDCFYYSGIAAAATALAVTDSIAIGLGIMPAVARNAAFSAMEIATLANLYPGRFLPGIGHGVGIWMEQIGAYPASPLTALDEVTTAVRALLRGDEITTEGRYVQLDHVQLEYSPSTVPPVQLGVRGPKSLALSGRVADGTILAEGSSPAYVRWAREQIAAGQREAGRTGPHRVTVFTMCSVDSDRAAARDRLRPMLATYIARPRVRAQIEPFGIVPELQALLDQGGVEHLAATLPDAWLDQLAVVGTPDDCANAINRLVEAGTDAVVLVPLQTGAEQVKVLADSIFPALGR